ncbi:hypothetical protein KY290_021216 [Solanum tuberosum]|uniref:Uncharacterized protein n=1 Tax=Solanum tuberosum TaxID=4113 RepID=A0ABQ7V1V7_SOLTU|nr:hypothetical protein KY290_021216 [Solanum tuberosum]
MIKSFISFCAEECCIGSFLDYTKQHDEESPAEFFADNKNIAGFDNPGKCLYTTVRELVENALDSAESISELPVVEITILVNEARVLEIQAKNVALGKKVKDPAATKAVKGREASYYRVTCKECAWVRKVEKVGNDELLYNVQGGGKYPSRTHLLESPAEFFADNKSIAGFDNPGKWLYTTMRELVENALDSADIVDITIEEIGRSKFNSLIGLADHERRDEALYDDFVTAKAREKRLAKESQVLVQAKNVALGKKVKDPAATKAARSREASYYRVTCKV